MIFPGFPGILSFFQVFQVEWEPWILYLHLPATPVLLIPLGVGVLEPSSQKYPAAQTPVSSNECGISQ